MKCLICSSNTDSFVDEKLGIVCHSCPNCGLIFKDPSLHQTFLEQKKRYDLHQNNSKSDGYRKYFQNFLDFVLPIVVKPSKILDFGCGESTLLSDMFTELGMECDYYDPIYHPDTNYTANKYDLIVSVEVFEHLQDPMRVFAELLSLLTQGGHLVIRTELHSSDIEKYLQWYYPKDPTHIAFFSTNTFRYMCEVTGCKYITDNTKNIIVLSSL